MRVKVVEYQTDVSNPYGKKAGQRLDSILVKTCVGAKKSSLSWAPWSLETKDAASFPASDESYDTWPTPVYPFDGNRTFTPGECVKGWIEFYVTKGTKPVRVVYASDSGTHRWAL